MAGSLFRCELLSRDRRDAPVDDPDDSRDHRAPEVVGVLTAHDPLTPELSDLDVSILPARPGLPSKNVFVSIAPKRRRSRRPR